MEKAMEKHGKNMEKHGTPWKNMGKYGKIWDMNGIINGINLGENLDFPWDFTMVKYALSGNPRGEVSRGKGTKIAIWRFPKMGGTSKSSIFVWDFPL